MRPEEVFDAFYRSTRDDLLHQAFLLTGDLRAASGAVRDAYVAAWQHWSRVSRHDDPLDYVRPLAWRNAQRRHRGRIWHRNRGISAEDRSVLDALHKVPGPQRRMLLLIEVAGLEMKEAGIEAGVTVEAAEIRLREGRAGFVKALGIPEGDISARLAEVGYSSTATGGLPRTSIVIRAGHKRRRIQGVTLVAGTLAVTLAAGAVASDSGRSRPGVDGAEFLPSASPSADGTGSTTDAVGTYQLISAETLTRLVPGSSWEEKRTDGNTDGDGLNSPCQTTRFADPNGVSALVRVFSATGKEPLKAVETVETSRNTRRARAAYRTMIGWFGGCQASRTTLARSFGVDGLGDEGMLIYVKADSRKPRAHSVAIARTGTKTVALALTSPPDTSPPAKRLVTALGEALDRICEGDGCVSEAPTFEAALPPVDSRFGLLAAVDLPPVGNVTDIWVGTEPSGGKEPPATAACSTPRFRKSAEMTRSRTFLIPQAKLPTSFGLAETVGSFGARSDAVAFSRRLVSSLRTCAKKDFTEDLRRVGDLNSQNVVWSTWYLSTRLSRQKVLDVRIAVVRNGTRVALVTYTPTGKTDMSKRQFNTLAQRAADRLGTWNSP